MKKKTTWIMRGNTLSLYDGGSAVHIPFSKEVGEIIKTAMEMSGMGQEPDILPRYTAQITLRDKIGKGD